MNGVSVPISRDPREVHPHSTMWERSKKMAIDEPGSKFSPDTKSGSALDLGLPTPQNCKK